VPKRRARGGKTADAPQRPARYPTAMIIAEKLGVSKSTVSRALKNDTSISETVRRKVQRLADEIGYRPNAAARGLITRKSGIVGLIVGESQNPFYSEQLDRLLIHLAERNLQLMLFRVPDGGSVGDVIPVVLQYQLDACILASVSVTTQADRMLAAQELPTVLLNRVPGRSHGSAVLCNNMDGGRLIGEHLLDCGASRIAFIAGPENASTSIEREEGLRLSLEAAGKTLFDKAPGDYSFDGGAAAMRALLANPQLPDAVFAANDIMALGAIDAMRSAGLHVPHDVLVAGFDDITAARWPGYDLTTVAQPVDAMLSRVLDIIKNADAGFANGETIYLNGKLQIRGSTRV